MTHPTFKDMMQDVVFWGSCCECGSCVLVCPHNVIEYVDGKPKQTAKAAAAHDYCGISEGIGCDVCAAVCPRLYPKEWHLKDLLFGNDRPYEGAFGTYRTIQVARAKDPGMLAAGEDGGVVTTILEWAMREGVIDGAVTASLDGKLPCQPAPTVVTSVEELRKTAKSWYTYVPNNLGLEEVKKKGLEKVAFVGVPCQITPIRKMELCDPDFIKTPDKRPKIVEKQEEFLKGFSRRVALNIGLFCTEVFNYQGLMVEKIQGELGVPLSDVVKFNVKGKVLVYKKDGETVELKLKECATKYGRPECHHCGDFSAELADIACGGVGAMGWTIVVTRTPRGEEIWNRVEASGLVEVKSIEDFEKSLRVLNILAERQTKRVPEGTRLRGMPRAPLEGGVVQRTGTEPIETGTLLDA
jgi:coenzyme F420 hydrogenase subunit beta